MCDGRGATIGLAFDEEPHHFGPDRAIAQWLMDPPGAVVQFMKPVKGTLALSEWLVGPAFEFLSSRYPPEQRFVAILDLSLMNGRSAAGRALLLRQAGGIGQRFSRFYVVPPIEFPPMYLKAFRASVALARSFGVDVVVASSSRAVVNECGFRPQAKGSRCSSSA